MRVLLINAVCGTGSTGKICAAIAQQYEQEGHEAKIAYGRDGFVPEAFQKYAVRIGNDLDVRLHGVYTRLTDRHGFASRAATRKFLQWASEYDPDVVWLHNIHGYYINIELLFQWIKSRPSMQVKWTLHDCWAFTGHCSYFDFVGCNKWNTGCLKCPQKKSYPASLMMDASKWNFGKKKELFTGVANMTLITPSKWLADLVKQSFLKEYPVEVVYNTINTEVFKPTPGDFRERYGLQDKKIILGVASTWEKRKGLDDFVKLAGLLDDKYQIVLVGVKAEQAKNLPKNILSIARTNNQKELAEIYTAADVFLNPTYEDNYPTVNLEAQACGTRVITYDTGGCKETLQGQGGQVVPQGVEHLYYALGERKENQSFGGVDNCEKSE